MAYKFQRGAAKLSGSITLEDNFQVDGTITLADGSLNIRDLDIDGGSATTSLAQADLFIVDDGAAGVNNKITFSNLEDSIFASIDGASSDIALAAGGALTLAANCVDSSELVNGSVDLSHMSVNSVDSDQYVDGSIDLIHMSANSIDSDQYVDGSIDLVHMSANSVDSDQYVDGSIDTVHIADNQVTLAKMAGITRGSILIGDASGDPAALAKGAASTFLQSDGTDVAYVAMSGDATLSAGAITIAANAVSLAKMAGLARGKFIIGDASGDPSALALGSAHQFFQSDGTDAAWVSMSGDVTLAAGVATIGANAVQTGMVHDDVAAELAGNGLNATAGVLRLNADPSSFKNDASGLQLSGSVAGNGLNLALGVLSVDIDECAELAATPHATQDEYLISDNGTEKRISVTNAANGAFALVSGDATIAAGGALTIANTSVEFAMMAANSVDSDQYVDGSIDLVHMSVNSIDSDQYVDGSVDNVHLANSSVSFGGISLALGASDATPAFNLSDATAYLGDSALVTAGALNAGSITSGFGSIDNGAAAITTTGTGSFGTVVIAGDLTVSGNTTTINTTALAIADHNIVLDRDNGTSAVIDGAGFTIEGGSGDDLTFQWLAGSTRMELKLASAYADLKMGVLDAVDGVFGGEVSCKGVAETVFAVTAAATLNFANGSIIKCSAGAEAYTIVLPAASGNSGKSFKIKRADAATHVITLDANGSETIDGYTTLALESDYAGLTLICDGSNWLIL